MSSSVGDPGNAWSSFKSLQEVRQRVAHRGRGPICAECRTRAVCEAKQQIRTDHLANLAVFDP